MLRSAWRLVRVYGVATLLVAGLGYTFVTVALFGAGPTPQLPPDGYVAERGRVDLQWHRGNRAGEIRLQVAETGGNFRETVVDRVESGTTLSLRGLDPDRTYSWRLMQNGRTSRVASFKTPRSHVDF